MMLVCGALASRKRRVGPAFKAAGAGFHHLQHFNFDTLIEPQLIEGLVTNLAVFKVDNNGAAI